MVHRGISTPLHTFSVEKQHSGHRIFGAAAPCSVLLTADDRMSERRADLDAGDAVAINNVEFADSQNA